jgi:hypothetical protein
MSSKTQNINNATAIVVNASSLTKEVEITMLSICNKTAGALTFSVFKNDGTTNYNIVSTSAIAANTPIFLTGIFLQPTWTLLVTTSGNCDVDVNYR